MRHFGPRPLTGDGSITSEATTLLNAKLGYRFASVAVSLDVLNLLDSEAPDVSYFYASRLPGEAAAGVEDVHFHPVIPRTARLTAVGASEGWSLWRRACARGPSSARRRRPEPPAEAFLHQRLAVRGAMAVVDCTRCRGAAPFGNSQSDAP